MKRILLLLVFGVMGLGLWAQTPYDTVNVYDPQNFTEMTTIDPANFQFIGRKNSLNRRVHVDTMRNYMTPAVVHAWLGDPLDSVNVLSSYWRQFVTDSLGRVWYVDADGDAKMLLDPTGGSVGSASAGYLTWWNTATTITNTDVAYTSTLLDADMLTGAFGFPLGTTAQRPGVSTGRARFNSDLGDLEFYNGSAWRSLPESSANAFTAGQFIIANPAGILSDTTAAGALSMMGGTSGSGASPQVAYWSGASTLTGHANFLWDGTDLSVGTTNSSYTLDIGTGGLRIDGQSAAPIGAAGVVYYDTDDNRTYYHNGTSFAPFVTGTGVATYISHWDAAGNQAADGVARIVSSEVRLGDAPTVDKGAYSTQITGDFFIGGTSTNPNMTYVGYGNNLNSTFSLQTSGNFASSEALYATNSASSFGVAEFVATSGSSNLRLENSSSSAATPSIIASHNATGVHTILRADTRNSWSHCCGQTNQDNVWDFNFEAYRSGSGWSVQGQSNAAKIRVGNLGGVYPATDDYDAYFDFQIRKDSVLTTGLFVSGGNATGIGGAFGVGIFDATPSSTLDVGGKVRIQSLPDSLFRYEVRADANGRLARQEGAVVGAISTSTDGSGDITVTHGMGTTPTAVLVTPTGTTAWIVSVHTIGATTFKVRFYDAAGAAVLSTAVTATWLGKT